MIQHVDEALKRLLLSELSTTPDTVITDGSQVTFEAPAAAEAADKPASRVNLYLHDVRENLHLRDESYAVIRKPDEFTAGRKRPPVRLDLSYVVTAHASQAADEHRILTDTLGVLLRHLEIPVEHMPDDMPGRGMYSFPISVAQPDHPAHSNPDLLWQALGGNMRPAIGLVVTATFDPFETKWTKVVREAVFAFGHGVPPHGPRRPFDLTGVRVSAAGIVTSEDGQTPLVDVTVTVNGRDERTTTDKRGFFHILNLPPGPRKLLFRKRGCRSAEMDVTVPPPGRPELLNPIVVAMPSLDDADRAVEEKVLAEAARNAPDLVEMERVYHVSLVGRLRHPDGLPAAYVPVRVGRHHTTTDADGVYCFYDLPQGEHQLFADLPGVGEVEVKTNNGAGTLALPAPDADKSTTKPTRPRKEG